MRSAGRDHPRERLLTPEVLAGLANLELVARAVVDGSIAGLHRSTDFGFSQEFAEYRLYNPGDDLRYIDWNVFARTDRTYVKRFYGSTSTRLLVMLDVSASMQPGLPGSAVLSKLAYARFVAAALIHLAHRQHDAAGLMLFDDSVREFHPPSARALEIRHLYHVLDKAEAGGATRWSEVLQQAGARIRGRSLMVLISDCYLPPEAFGRALKQLGVRGHDLLVLHLLTPEEKQGPAAGVVTLEDVESHQRLDVDALDLETNYRQRLADHLQAMRRAVLASGGHYLQVDTDQPLNSMLHQYLTFRARHP